MGRRYRAKDLFCCAGGASRGLAEAGFEVDGVDIAPQPEYPYAFTQGDALAAELDGYDLVWASPPCQAHSAMTRDKSAHADLIPATRAKLQAWGGAYIIENVVGAPLVDPVLLCGAMFGLGTIRHRLFETNFVVLAPEHPKHRGSLVTGEYVTVTGNGGVPAWTMKQREARGLPRHRPGEMKLDHWRAAMGIDWMSRKALTQAIPPAYARFLGEWAKRAIDGARRGAS